MDVIVGLIGILIALFIYFIPSFIAHKRGHKNKLPIILLNLFFGWSLVGWVGALIWSLMDAISVEQSNKSTGTSRAADELERLHSLKEKGIITEEDFNKKKADLLS
jgi:uncharacterized membrane protein